jgi:hypothetical protein
MKILPFFKAVAAPVVVKPAVMVSTLTASPVALKVNLPILTLVA